MRKRLLTSQVGFKVAPGTERRLRRVLKMSATSTGPAYTRAQMARHAMEFGLAWYEYAYRSGVALRRPPGTPV